MAGTVSKGRQVQKWPLHVCLSKGAVDWDPADSKVVVPAKKMEGWTGGFISARLIIVKKYSTSLKLETVVLSLSTSYAGQHQERQIPNVTVVPIKIK